MRGMRKYDNNLFGYMKYQNYGPQNFHSRQVKIQRHKKNTQNILFLVRGSNETNEEIF